MLDEPTPEPTEELAEEQPESLKSPENPEEVPEEVPTDAVQEEVKEEPHVVAPMQQNFINDAAEELKEGSDDNDSNNDNDLTLEDVPHEEVTEVAEVEEEL